MHMATYPYTNRNLSIPCIFEPIILSPLPSDEFIVHLFLSVYLPHLFASFLPHPFTRNVTLVTGSGHHSSGPQRGQARLLPAVQGMADVAVVLVLL